MACATRLEDGTALAARHDEAVISYAQNQEDVVLSRLLPLVEHGCYIDVGAAHPILENVTYALYLAGWRGINIEPMPREVAMLTAERPEDVTLQVAVSDVVERITLFEAPLENRGATTSSEATAERYREQGQEFVEFEVDTMLLRDVWAQHVSGEVHVLKIDVEGMELRALRGADLDRHKPWVLVIEATAPNSQEQTWQEWEPVVLGAGYEFTLFDGLNRFYVHSSHPELVEAMSTPANVFDAWKLHTTILTERRADRAAAYVRELAARGADAERYAQSLLERARRAEEYASALATERESLMKQVALLSQRLGNDELPAVDDRLS